MRAVDLAARVFPEHREQLHRARSRFDKHVHRACDVRDVLEHFDDYAQAEGKRRMGHLIRDDDRGIPPIFGFQISPDGVVMTITIYREVGDDDISIAEELALDTRIATAAALALADDALKLLDYRPAFT